MSPVSPELWASALGVVAAWYMIGCLRTIHRKIPKRLVGLPNIVSMAGGVGVLGLALMPPVATLAHQTLSAHMTQHLLVMLVAVPLIVWGRPAPIFLQALPQHAGSVLEKICRDRASIHLLGIVRRPATAWLAFSGSIILWHLPACFRWAMGSEAGHALMIVSFLIAAVLFWSAVLDRSEPRRLTHGHAILFVFTTALITGIPGALMALSRRPIYGMSAHNALPFGLTPLGDQQLAGLIMWIPMDVILFSVAGVLFVNLLQSAERRLAFMRIGAIAAFAIPAPFFLSASNARAADISSGVQSAATRGATLIAWYGCGSCHLIPGIATATGLVGPPLTMMAQRLYIAGMLRNSPDNMVVWLRNPQAIVPGNAMPNMGVSEHDARDIAAYLSALN